MSYHRGPQIPKDNLEFYIDAANLKCYPGTGSTAYNIVGSNNITLGSGAYYSDDYSGVFNFDGINDYLFLPTTGRITNWSSFTWEIWFNKNTSTYQYLISEDYPRVDINSSNQLRLSLSSSISNVIVSTVQLNYWNHSVFSVYYDGSVTKLNAYLNGNLVVSDTYNTELSFPNSWLYLGSSSVGYNFSGQISLFKIYSRGLNSDEVLENYNSMVLRYR